MRKQVACSLYRTRNQVGEQTDEETIVEEGPRSLNPAFVDIHDVGHFLKCIKGNARGENDAHQGQRKIVNTKPVHRTNKGAREEVKVFEDSKNREIQDD